MSTLIETLRMRADIEARLSGTDRSGGLYLEAAALIEQQAAKIAELADDLERTRHERNFSHVQARREISKEHRAYIAKLQAQIAAVAPAVDAQPVAWFQNTAATGDAPHYEQVAKQFYGPPAIPLYASAQSEGLRKDAWQPIEIAPRDGTPILMTNGKQVAQGQWISDPGYIRERRDIDGRYIGQDESDGYDGWMDYDGGMPDPTHWQPLPAPPGILSQHKAGEKDD
jgi:hypothetical protein